MFGLSCVFFHILHIFTPLNAFRPLISFVPDAILTLPMLWMEDFYGPEKSAAAAYRSYFAAGDLPGHGTGGLPTDGTIPAYHF